MISVPLGTGDISLDMISAPQMIYAYAYEGTDIISYRLGDISFKHFPIWNMFAFRASIFHFRQVRPEHPQQQRATSRIHFVQVLLRLLLWYNLYAEIVNAQITGISEIAFLDGAEAVAEIEVLISRGVDVPKEALEFYLKYVRRPSI